MLNTFLGIETLTRGLMVQELNQNVTASNLAKKYQDSDGYLISSRQRVNLMESSPFIFSSFSGRMAVGTGPLVQQITRLRNSFLDMQIQRESSTLGRAEVLTSALNQINGIVNVSGATLDKAIDDLAAAFTALAPSPLNVGLRSAAVNSGVAFATLARNQYNQLESVQKNFNAQVEQTVKDINQILQQLSLYNKELSNNPGTNMNDLLDARDYALARLSRLVNIHVNFGNSGTVDVRLSNSNLSLVDGAGAAVLQTNLMNGHNPGLVNITIQSSEGTITLPDTTRSITGGRLGGLLYDRDVVVEGYKTQVDQIATSVMNVTNIFHTSGYAADGVTTGVSFFTGTGAGDINVNASLTADTTRALLSASSRLGVPANGQIAQFIGNIKNLLANNYMQSRPAVSAGVINPTMAISTQPFVTIPTAAGSFTVNGVTVNWTNANTTYEILDMINAADPNVQAVFNATNRNFFILSNNPINVVNTAGNFIQVATLNNVLVSTVRMNNGFAPSDPTIVYGFPLAANSGLNSLPNSAIALPNGSGNLQAFRVTPSLGGSFTLNGVTLTWYNSGASVPNNPPGVPIQPLNENLFYILNNLIGGAVYPGTTITPVFNTTSQTLTLFSSNAPRPIQIVDNTGNFTVFTGLNGNTSIGNLSSGLLTRVSSELTSQQIIESQSAAVLDQLNTSQANLAAVSFSSTDPGVPFEVEQENAVKALIAFNASLQVMQVLNQMYADLVSIVGGAPSNNFLNGRR